jgi:uncharacterized glyoxalase superfamily protein PhnB
MPRKSARKVSAKKNAAKKSAPRKAASAKARRAAPARQAAAPRQPKWKPEKMHDVVANLVFKDAAGAIEFYKQAFGAKELMRMIAPGGRSVWHAELRIGDSTIFLNDEMPESPTAAPGPGHKPTTTLQLYVPDCDAVFNRAVQAGAKPGMPLMEMFWGDRMGSLIDPFGQVWMISTRVKNLTQEEMRKGGEEFAARMAAQQQGAPQEQRPS